MDKINDPRTQHRLAWDLIPWVVNGRASEEERRNVIEHLRSCGDCRDEFAFQRNLHLAMAVKPAAPVSEPGPALERLWQRIDQPKLAAAPAVPVNRRSSRRYLVPALAATVMAQMIGLGLLAPGLWQQGEGGHQYRTLSAAAHPVQQATIRVVLVPSMTLAELQALLGMLRVQIVDGPTEAGVYSLAPLAGFDVAANSKALATLRSNPSVRFAEPIETVSVPPR